MNPAAYVDQARDWSRRLEDRERTRSGTKLKDAREAVARRIAIPPGTMQNLRKNRLKTIAVHWYDRLKAGVIRGLEAELRHLEHELTILRQSGADPRHSAIEAVVADLTRVRLALGLPSVSVSRSPAENGGGDG